MFLGEYEHSVDDKGRIAVPARFREELDQGIIATQGFDGCLQVFPRQTWETLRQRVSSLTLGTQEARDLRRLLFAGAADLELDRQGRVLVTSNQRIHAGLKEQVVLVGLDTYFEIWDAERWRGVIDSINSRSSELATQLAGLGM